MNSLGPIAKAAGIVLCALGLGITEMPALINDPKAWKSQFQALEEQYPETAGAIARLRALGALPPRDRAAQTYSLLSKLALFEQESHFRAIFGASKPGIHWREVFKKKQAVLIDLRDVDVEAKRFCLLWVYYSFLTYIKQRGHGYMDKPVSFIIDELSDMVGSA